MAVSCKRIERDFPGSSVVKTLHSAEVGTDSILGWGAKVSYAMRGGWPKKKGWEGGNLWEGIMMYWLEVRWKKRQDQGREDENELGVYLVPGDVPGAVPT